MKNKWSATPLTGGLGQHAAVWDQLNQQRFKSNPMLDSRFVDALLKYFGTGEEYLCSLPATSMTTPAAMCLLKPRGTGIWTTFLPSQAQVGPVLIGKSSAVASLMRDLPGIVGSLDILCHDSVFGDLSLDNARANRKDHALTMSISLDGDFASYWAQRSKQLQKNMRRYERRVETDLISPRFSCLSSPSDMEAAVARYATLESKGWKGELGTAVGIDNTQGMFYSDVMRRFAESGNAVVYELWLGEQLAASRLVISSAEMLVILKTTYDETMDKYAPGRLLLREVIQRAFISHPGKVIEFYTDANADQLAWATAQRWIRHINFPSSAIAASFYQVARFGRRLWRPNHKSAEDARPLSTVDVFQHPDQLPPDVVALFESAEIENIEFGVSWYKILVNAVYAGHEQVRIYVLRSNGRPVAALPVIAQRGALGLNIEALSNYYTAVYAPVTVTGLTGLEMVPLLHAVRRAHAPLGSLRFSPMDPQSATYLILREAMRAAGLVPFDFFCFGNWYLTVNGNWESYLMGRTGTLRSTIKRMSKKFVADGGTLELVQDQADIDKALQAYEQVYAASWKNTEPYPDFVRGLVQTCAERGWLRMGVAWLNGKPIAAQIWIVANDKANIYKVAYDENYKAYAPGTLLTAMLMQHALETDNVAKVDYLIGDDTYKKTWMSHRQERWGIVAYNPRSLGGLLGLAREALGRGLKPWLAKLQTRK